MQLPRAHPSQSHCLVLTSFIPSQNVWDELFISNYNVAYTSLPVVIMGAIDQDVTPITATRFPGLYYPGMAKLWFSRKVFSNFAIHGLVTSLVLIGFIMGKTRNYSMVIKPFVFFDVFVDT